MHDGPIETKSPHPSFAKGGTGGFDMEAATAGYAAVILAAGASIRMGTPKQLLTFDGRTLIRRTIEAAQGALCRPILVVLGAHADQIRPETADLDVFVLQNPEWPEGMASSIRVAMQTLQARTPAPGGAILTVCDQPYVSSEHLRTLIQTSRSSRQPIVASQYVGILGVPALFAPNLWPELLALTGESGARSVIRRHVREVCPVPFPEGACDLDTPEDILSIGARYFDAPPRERR